MNAERDRLLDSVMAADAADFGSYEIAPDRARNACCPICGAPAERTTVDLAGASLRQTTVRCLADGPRCQVRVEHEPIPVLPAVVARLCSRCKSAPPKPSSSYCGPCRAARDREASDREPAKKRKEITMPETTIETAPLCPCGCGRSVSRNRRNGAWCNYAEKACGDKMRYATRKTTPSTKPLSEGRTSSEETRCPIMTAVVAIESVADKLSAVLQIVEARRTMRQAQAEADRLLAEAKQ